MPEFRSEQPPADRRVAGVSHGLLTVPGVHAPLPADVYVWPGARSYTREPVVEIHTPGSPPLLEAVLAAVCAAGARPALPGEFTLRAFVSGRLDLTQAEAVLGAIDAENAGQFSAALSQMAGGLTAPLHRLRDELLELLAHLEAGLDFVEEDISFISADELQRQLTSALAAAAAVWQQLQGREAADHRRRLVLAGAPNVGKSTLFNALAGSPRAIVSSQAGATRDYLTCDDELAGVPCRWIDTAGLEWRADLDPPPPVSASAGIQRAAQDAGRNQQSAADLLIVCLDASRPLTGQEQSWLAAVFARIPPEKRLVVWTKGDLPPAKEFCDVGEGSPHSSGRNIFMPASAPALAGPGVQFATGHGGHESFSKNRGNRSDDPTGLKALRTAAAERLVRQQQLQGQAVASTAARCRDSLRRATDALQEALHAAQCGAGEELVAAAVRAALDELGQVVGAVYTDDLLDRIFSRFCIGK